MALSTPDDRLAAVAALADPTRKAVYELVLAAAAPVSRDEAADALGLRRATAALHLDRLAENGLLEVQFRRIGGRSGPGAGRPSKFYAAAVSEVGASVPPRDYGLAAELMARAIEESVRSGDPVAATLPRVSRQAGADSAEAARADAATGAPGDALQAVLRNTGYRPRPEGDGSVTLLECPFHQLSRNHRETVCGMNLEFLGAAAARSGGTLRAVPDPDGAGGCCVRLEPVAESPTSE
ncbi:helix-turn-helix domain-containing protein [Arthrobacter ginkgonis]|uniref:Helix-turn-helix domain-containing protein n=1 Tax=Arthrobacter ginkgonis TaxID=1630594 RepID=A0ABP7CM96_9MICC